MTVQISFFSGTGCTEHVARTFAKEFKRRGHDVLCHSIMDRDALNDRFDLLVICYVVHASNAPEPVMAWVKRLAGEKGTPVAIISVSGGGEVIPNLACRVPMKRAFRRKGYRIFYEKMLVMPSNWIIETKPSICAELIHHLPYKISYAVSEILKGGGECRRLFLINRLLTWLGRFEHRGAHLFGKNIQVGASCQGCRLCIEACPVSNIGFHKGKPVFGKKCVMCLNCLYSCPQRALQPAFMKLVVLPQGFNIRKILSLPRVKSLDLDRDAKGLFWIGVKRYLSNTTDMESHRLDSR